jgi:protein-S-isoprenylcysteine O-methyltransferase Ste14
MHIVYLYLFPVLWMGWALYWFVSSFSASVPKRIQNRGARLLHRAELALVAALLTFPQFGDGWLGRQIAPRSDGLFALAALLLVAGLGFAVWARVHLGNNWSGHVTLKPGHRLIRSGPYAIVRHPIYTGILTAMIGSAIAVDQYRGVLAVLIATETFVRKLRLEERWLTEEFGDEYVHYCREVKALIPGVV